MRSFLPSLLAVLTTFGPYAAAGDAPARIRVRLPADAALAIDGEPTQSTSDVRYFITTPLHAGTDYQYDLRAQLMWGGKKVTIDRRVTVRAGEETATDLYPAATESRPAPAPFTPSFEGRRPARTGPDRSVGGAGDNWKPDETDPFYPWQ